MFILASRINDFPTVKIVITVIEPQVVIALLLALANQKRKSIVAFRWHNIKLRFILQHKTLCLAVSVGGVKVESESQEWKQNHERN